MLEGEKSQRTFKLNNRAKVTVKSEKIDQDLYKHKVVVEYELTNLEPLKFKDKTALAELVQGFDLEEDQQALL
jgi:hypothetical protein